MIKTTKVMNDTVAFVTEGDVLKYLDILVEPTEKIVIHIPKEIDGQTINVIGSGTHSINRKPINTIMDSRSYNKNVSIVIDDRISKISKFAFAHININKLKWPKSCTEIPELCFKNSKIINLSGIDRVETIGVRAFENLCGVNAFNIPSACRTVEKGAFSGSCIRTVSGGENVVEVGINVFNGSSLTYFEWFPKAKIIPKWAFSKCLRLENVTGMENVEQIQENAFSSCMNLKSIIWPTKCPDIPAGCFKLSGIESIGGMENVHSIGDEAFGATSRLKKLHLSSKCKSVGKFAFTNSVLKELTGAENVETIGCAAFLNTNIEKFVWPNPCRTIPQKCFCGCNSLREFHFSDSLESIGLRAFFCTNLKTVDLSGTMVEVIEDSAFGNTKIEEFIPSFLCVVESRIFDSSSEKTS